MQPASTCNCEKSANESTETEEKKLGKKNVHARVAGHRALANVYIEIHYISFSFRAFISQKKSRFRVAGHTGALRQEHDFVVIVQSY